MESRRPHRSQTNQTASERNLAAYLASYFRQQESRVDDMVDTQWIFSAFFVAFSLAIVLSGYMAKALGTRPTIAIAVLIHSGATFLSYFAIKHSMEALIVTFGAVGGLGAGIAYGPPMPMVSKDMGMASSMQDMGMGSSMQDVGMASSMQNMGMGSSMRDMGVVCRI
ncbi:hypothetical protein ACOMHN_060307 [Nucella lapillus]